MRRYIVFLLVALFTGGCGSSAAVPPSTGAPIANVVADTDPAPPYRQTSVAAATSTSTPEPTVAPSATPEPTAAPSATPEPTVAPSAVPTAAPAPAAGAANRLVIGAIGLDQPLVSVGLDGNNVPIVPNHDVGWYNLSARPGQGDNVVLWGHVLRFKNAPNIPAPFARMQELAPGAQLVLYDAQGTPRTYAITRQVWATPDQVEYILPQGREMVTLVSCIGDKVIVSNSVELTHRLITIAEPMS